MRRVTVLAGHLQPSAVSSPPPISGQCSASSGEAPASAIVSPLDAERKRATFDSRQLTYFLDGGEHVTEIRELVAEAIGSDPTLVDEDLSRQYERTRAEQRRRSQQRFKHVVDMVRSQSNGADANTDTDNGTPSATSGSDRAGQGREFESAFYEFLGAIDPSWSIKAGVHYGLFAGAITSNGDAEQRRQWEPLVRTVKIIGGFALTEMGHGSHTANIETTATFDPATDTIVIHSPTITATKFWIGGAAQSATHLAVFARLIVGGSDKGVQCMVVPVRDANTGAVLPSIELGDMGSKMGRDGLDNGWIRFHHARIPRTNLLMKYIRLERDGTFMPAPAKELTYSSLVNTRIELLLASAHTVKKAAVIATRYACVRRQGGSAGSERTIIDYQTHRHRLLPVLSLAFALHFTAKTMQHITETNTSTNLAALRSLHATSSGLKAFATWQTAEAIETCRQSCGGLGYSSYSGLPSLANDWAVNMSWEGDNTILTLQCAKFLLANRKQHRSQSPPLAAAINGDGNDAMDYLSTDRSSSSPSVDFTSSTFQLYCLQSRVLYDLDRLLALSADKLPRSIIDSHSIDCLTLVKLHCQSFTLRCFHRAIKLADTSIRPVLTSLANLYFTTILIERFTLIAETGAFGPSLAVVASCHQSLRDYHSQLLDSVRRDCIAITDSFNLPDFVVNSPLGRSDGNVYEHLLACVQGSAPVNRVPDFFDEFVKPITASEVTEQ